jgi:hypothetical protein
VTDDDLRELADEVRDRLGALTGDVSDQLETQRAEILRLQFDQRAALRDQFDEQRADLRAALSRVPDSVDAAVETLRALGVRLTVDAAETQDLQTQQQTALARDRERDQQSWRSLQDEVLREVSAQLDAGFGQVRDRLEEGLAALGARIETIESRLAGAGDAPRPAAEPPAATEPEGPSEPDTASQGAAATDPASEPAPAPEPRTPRSEEPSRGSARARPRRSAGSAARPRSPVRRPSTSVATPREVLAQVRGVGPAKQSALIDTFGTLAALRAASVAELASVTGIGRSLAEDIHDHLHGAGGRSEGSAAEGSAED